MMTVDFTSEAKEDLFHAVDYFEQKERNLGRRVADEIADMLQTVVSAPYLWRLRQTGYRRVNCPVFPFYIAYVIRENAVVVLAIAASRMEPGYWYARLEK